MRGRNPLAMAFDVGARRSRCRRRNRTIHWPWLAPRSGRAVGLGARRSNGCCFAAVASMRVCDGAGGNGCGLISSRLHNALRYSAGICSEPREPGARTATLGFGQRSCSCSAAGAFYSRCMARQFHKQCAARSHGCDLLRPTFICAARAWATRLPRPRRFCSRERALGAGGVVRWRWQCPERRDLAPHDRVRGMAVDRGPGQPGIKPGRLLPGTNLREGCLTGLRVR